MLYQTWRQVADASGPRLALRDLAARRAWTFAELAADVHSASPDPGPISCPQGASADFLRQVLLAWRAGNVVCPLEPGQARPEPGGKLPAGTVHLKTTSATTGTPRLVAFKAEQMLADAENIVQTMGLAPHAPNLGVLSLAHSYGYSNLVLPLLLHGIPLILVGASLPEAVRAAAAQEGRVTLAGVPALWQTWFDAGAIPPNLHLAISAGAPLPLALERSVFENRGLKIRNFYGSSECGGIAFDRTDHPRSDAACVGSAMANVDISIAGDGCVEVRGRAVGLSYWPEESPRLADGVFRTNDIAAMRGRELHLLGRAGDQINVAGRKVLPEAIEQILAGHPQVRACLAFGVPSADPQRGEQIVACVCPQGEVTVETLRQFLMARLPAWQVPREWWVVDGLEPNRRGKLSRADWRTRYLERTRA